ncbi:MAG: hypothetical protein ACLGJB_03775 [Blastocatellia bacterium]
MSKYPSTNMTYAGLEDKGLTVQVKDSQNPKTRWIIWKKDKDKPTEDSEAFADIQKKKIGEIFGVQYGEKEKSFVGREGNTVTYKERTIYRILPLVASETAPQAQSRPISQNLKPSEPVDWDKLGLIKAYHNLVAAHLANGKDFQYVTEQIEKGTYWLICKTIEADVTKRTATGWAKAEAIYKKPVEDLPTIQQDEEPPIEDIPF